MKFRLQSSIFIVLFTVFIVGLFSLNSDVKTLSQAEIAEKPTAIVVNQVGYLPQWQKIAFFLNNPKPTAHPQLIDNNTQKLVTTLSLGKEIQDTDTPDTISRIDFTDITKPGTYYLKQGKIESTPFKVGTDIYQQPLVTLLRSYYLQRCGVEIDDPVTGISHPPCHLKDGVIAHQDEYHPAGDNIPAVGGWHDAGDYGKYVTTTAVTIARLLNLYEQYPELFPDNHLSIPESGNGISDLLDEMQFGLDWLLKMQRTDGAVYRKLSGQKWPFGVSPDEDIQPRYIYGISTPETAKFAAVMAIASRNYQSINTELAAKFLSAAESAWQYLTLQPEMRVDWVEGDDSGSGKYLYSEFDREDSLKTDVDDRLWAAAELYITTGKSDFAGYFADHLDRIDYTLFEWKDPSPLALINYLKQNRQPVSEELIAQIKTKIKQRADLILNKVNQSAYHIANDRFIWGSNKMTAEEGITLVYAYQLTKNPAYLTAAIDQLDYLLGRNHFNQTFITGIGTNPVKNVNHLFARAKKIDIPGLVIGGPNSDAQDNKVAKNQGQLSYIDDEESYATNEYAIDYNASVISLITNLIAVDSN
ncbi:MAG: glycoside hydrolase family 9 protein [Pleurocapsa sp. MO_192.B19]|nr:glycoside hydrolase family 9 protein [Pleurocapsa sp. MO_192.B19]